MTRSRKKELCKHCKNRHQEYVSFDGDSFFLMVDRCKKGHNIHSSDPECLDFACKLGYKIKSIFVKRGDL